MRIRKNTKLASVLLATAGYGGERQETYVCHLNQSPWDVIPVTSSGDCDLTNLLDSSWFLPLSSSSSSSSSPPLLHQFNGEDSFNGDVSLGDCNGAAVSFVTVEKLNLNAAEDKYEMSPDANEPMDQSDDNSDKISESLPEPNSPFETSGDEDQACAVTMPAPPKRGRPRGTGKKALASAAASKNPYEFYYYSGFGPRWGRKRGGSDDEKIGLGDNNNNNKKSRSSDEEGDKTAAFGSGSVSFDYVEEDDVDVMDEDEESDHGKKKRKDKLMKKTIKRARKPVKERSLKSLM
ncbi:hypothetical protein CARUB_v10001568mg [Capsella rubella]|uniref:WRC domain-containing protein n=1 Tax=Capsella rubella TaxID=81985 RepID=R0GWC5_9BRAS|nr:uncharacterized protein LOC17883303 isoform X2 [Capsella rubella]EOA21219.1 hypothetical protein CARUB_v10001568mg [Capsella rubella]